MLNKNGELPWVCVCFFFCVCICIHFSPKKKKKKKNFSHIFFFKKKKKKGNPNPSFQTEDELLNKYLGMGVRDSLPKRTRFYTSLSDLLFEPAFEFYIDWEERLRTCKDRIYKVLSEDKPVRHRNSNGHNNNNNNNNNNSNRHSHHRYNRAVDENLLSVQQLHRMFAEATARAENIARENPRYVIPQAFVESKNGAYRLELLLPITIEYQQRKYYFALAIRPDQERQCYEGMSILTADMAYANARLVGMVDSKWLHTFIIESSPINEDDDYSRFNSNLGSFALSTTVNEGRQVDRNVNAKNNNYKVPSDNASIGNIPLLPSHLDQSIRFINTTQDLPAVTTSLIGKQLPSYHSTLPPLIVTPHQHLTSKDLSGLNPSVLSGLANSAANSSAPHSVTSSVLLLPLQQRDRDKDKDKGKEKEKEKEKEKGKDIEKEKEQEKKNSEGKDKTKEKEPQILTTEGLTKNEPILNSIGMTAATVENPLSCGNSVSQNSMSSLSNSDANGILQMNSLEAIEHNEKMRQVNAGTPINQVSTVDIPNATNEDKANKNVTREPTQSAKGTTFKFDDHCATADVKLNAIFEDRNSQKETSLWPGYKHEKVDASNNPSEAARTHNDSIVKSFSENALTKCADEMCPSIYDEFIGSETNIAQYFGDHGYDSNPSLNSFHSSQYPAYSGANPK
ncbi:hypothetical protein RFI_22784, partial [Reticulomyxa filosa]